MQNRFTWALKLEGNAWKIVHEHTRRPPIRSSDTKAIFQACVGSLSRFHGGGT